MIIDKFTVQFNKDSIFHLMDCHPKSDIYPLVEDEYENMVETAYAKITPRAVIEFGEIPKQLSTNKIMAGTKALYVITTIGKEISVWSTNLFKEGNYLAGMLANTMADDYLMQATESLKSYIIKQCQDRNFGVTARIEAPNELSMEAQKVAWEVTEAWKALGVGINESYMYDPVKTNCQIFLLKEGGKEYCVEHNCRACTAVNCKMRKVLPVRITIVQGLKEQVIYCRENQSILEALRENSIYITAICSGRGTCGKCKIKIIEGKLMPSKGDIKFFSEVERDGGYRLSCQAYPTEEIKISLQNNVESDFYIVADARINQRNETVFDTSYVLGIDIGTTTIAMALMGKTSKRIMGTYTSINQQRIYGADVISRIQASNQGQKKVLQECICRDLKKGIIEILEKKKEIKLEHIAIAGNTTMLHLLMGYSCETLGIYPFTPCHIEMLHTNAKTLLGDIPFMESESVSVTILPGISTYVGADIVSDLLYCNFYESIKVNMLIDLGTNGEMAIGNKDKVLVASTAAGPAFEGGNVVCGTGSIPGAICSIDIKDKGLLVRTIGDKKPIGICGTGIIEGIHELVKQDLIDETGLMEKPYFEEGYPLAKDEMGKILRIYQKDIREIQLAKAAVRAGVETLLLRYGINAIDIEKVYIAGGFGYKLDVTKAIGVGLLPKSFEKKAVAIGNGSLQGTLAYFIEESSDIQVEKIISVSSEVNLSADSAFSQFYMDSMYFEKD